MTDSKFEKLDRMRADIQRDKDKVTMLLERIKQKEARLKDAEGSAILDDVWSYNLTPEQVSEFLKLAASGKIDAIIKGAPPVANVRTPIVPDDDEDDEIDETEDNEDEE